MCGNMIIVDINHYRLCFSSTLMTNRLNITMLITAWRLRSTAAPSSTTASFGARAQVLVIPLVINKFQRHYHTNKNSTVDSSLHWVFEYVQVLQIHFDEDFGGFNIF